MINNREEEEEEEVNHLGSEVTTCLTCPHHSDFTLVFPHGGKHRYSTCVGGAVHHRDITRLSARL
ncbi:hypothetical protein INR49_009331 [Caranx melampygus]|nr:hypothetical protein INR49_009331 [Caranx melampygus]